MSAAKDARLIATIPSQCVLGEGPVWDDRAGCLWFTDIQQARLLRWDHAAGLLDRLDLPERLGSLALTEDPERLLCGFASGFAFFQPANGAVEWLHRIEPVYRGLRLNDGRVDRFGRFWCGSMVEDETIAPAERGTLYRLDPPGGVSPLAMRSGIGISNSLCFSPDGRDVYFADTPTRQLVRYRYPEDGASLDEGVTFAQLAEGASPDGSDVDASGRLWNAEWGAGRVTGYAPDGSVAAQIDLPISQPTCVAFGGDNLELMFVTSASEGLSAEARQAEPHAGDVFVYSGDFRGLPAGRFGVSQIAPTIVALVFLFLAMVGLAPAQAWAGTLALSAPFTDHAVIQRDQPVNVHGQAAPGAKVSLSFAGIAGSAKAGRDGHWRIALPAMAARDGSDLVVESNGERVTATDVAVGDVFLCSGQSNMEFTMAEGLMPHGRKASDLDSSLRLLQVARDVSATARSGFTAPPAWQPANQAGMKFSAICQLYGREVAKQHKVAVGLIGSYWGGTPIEAWLPRDALAQVGGMAKAVEVLDAYKADSAAAEARYGAGLAAIWQPDGTADPRRAFAVLYNAMIAPLADYPLAGVLWYQGENNANSGDSIAAYRTRLGALFASWRQQFGRDVPFIVIQLAGFDPDHNAVRNEGWARVREAQRETVESDRRAALVVALDLGERFDIHPPYKLPVAKRAFQAAEHLIYGAPGVPSGPRVLAANRQGDVITIAIGDAQGQLSAQSWGRPGPFMLCSEGRAQEDCRFVDAELAGQSIRIAVPAGMTADRVRYCWGGYPLCNVYDDANLPLGAFELPIAAAGEATAKHD